MARMNLEAVGPQVRTAAGAQAVHLPPLKALRRLVLTALLWEDTFYAKGSALAKEIAALVTQCAPEDVAALAIEARESMYLRHVPLFLVRELARVKGRGPLVARTLAQVIQRPDEMGEYLAMYWGGVSKTPRPSPLSAGSKRGLRTAFQRFSAYQLAKYDRDATVKLRDVLRLVHATPKDAAQAALWKQVITRTLDAPDTWEVALSAGQNKRATFERLLTEKKLGGLAFLRNLRNMVEAEVDPALMRARFAAPFGKVLPFRFLAAAAHAPRWEAEIEAAMLASVATLPKLSGTTALVVDVSGSMSAALSGKSELNRLGVAAALAILVREQSEHAILIATAGNDLTRRHATVELPARRGMAVRDLIMTAAGSLGGGGIFLVQCLEAARDLIGRSVDRVIVLTDEQDCDVKLRPDQANTFGRWNYLINISNEKHGIGYGQKWTAHIDGWSERVLDFILAAEAQSLQ